MSDEITIDYTDQGSKASYTARIPGVDDAAELTVSVASPSLVIADHTAVPDSLRGRGLAGALAKRLFEDAAAKGFKVMPLCPFVRSYAAKHKDEVAGLLS